MKPSNTISAIVLLIALLGFITSGFGLFWQQSGEPFAFTPVHGQTVLLDGRGLYRNDTLLSASTFRGADLITLFIVEPLLLLALLRYRRGSLRGSFLLLGALACFLYNAASMAFGAAYNPLFLVYIALFSLSLFGVLGLIATLDLPALPAHILPGLRHRGTAIFLFVTGTVLMLVWLSDLLSAMLTGQPPLSLGSSTTIVTYVLDLGIITPALFLAGILLLRRSPIGYPLAFILLYLCLIIGFVVISQTIVGLLYGVVLSLAQLLIFVVSFIILSLVSAWFSSSLLRHITDTSMATANLPVSPVAVTR